MRTRDAAIIDDTPRELGSALEMIAACFRHQHPEAFGRPPVPGAILPVEVRYGRDEMRQSAPSEAMSEELMGHPDAAPLGDVAAAGLREVDL